MRRISPLATYNRVLAQLKPDPSNEFRLAQSELAIMAAGESKLLISFLRWSGCNEN